MADVPVQAYAFMGAVAAFLVILVVFFLYLNKKLCFNECGGFPCIDHPTKKKEHKTSKLGKNKELLNKKHKHYGAPDGFVNLNEVESDAYSHDTVSTTSGVALLGKQRPEPPDRYEEQDNILLGESALHSQDEEPDGRVEYPSQPKLVSGGSAYAYDDAETSSDSDDEVLRRYHQTMGMQRAPSKHSIRSARSTTSKTSKAASKGASKPGPGESPGDTTDKDMLLSKAEEGQAPTPEENKGEELAATTSTHEYQNNAFAGTEEVSPADHASENISAYGDAASMSIGDVEQDEHLFDVSDLQDREQAIISKCGNLEVSFSYSYERARMSVTVHRAVEIPSKDRGGANNAQIRLLLLPTKKVRHKTKIKPGENPEFNETFSIKVPPEEINNMGVRFRLYGCERMRRERMIGESVIGFASLNQDEETTHMLQLEPRSNLSHGDSNLDVASLSRSDSASSTQSMQHGGMPELLVGLAYNGTTGRLCVEVIKGSNFRNMAMNRAPDTYVKLTLMSPTGQEIARSKTSIRRGQPNPLYKETFMFQVALFQLPEVTLMTSVYNKRSMKRKEMIGWFSLGKNNSGEEELAHWNDMRESKGEQVCRWHVLLES